MLFDEVRLVFSYGIPKLPKLEKCKQLNKQGTKQINHSELINETINTDADKRKKRHIE